MISLALIATLAMADLHGSVEMICNPTVCGIDTSSLRESSLEVREAFGQRRKQCDVPIVLAVLALTGEARGLPRHLRVEVDAGGFQGRTTPATTMINSNDSVDAMEALVNSLVVVWGQGSGYLFSDRGEELTDGFPTNAVEVRFSRRLSISESATFFEQVGVYDPDLFEFGGYTAFSVGQGTLIQSVLFGGSALGYDLAAADSGAVSTLLDGTVSFPEGDVSDLRPLAQWALDWLRRRHDRATVRALELLERDLPEHRLIRRLERMRC